MEVRRHLSWFLPFRNSTDALGAPGAFPVGAAGVVAAGSPRGSWGCALGLGFAAETVVVPMEKMGWLKEAPNLLLPFLSLPKLFFSSLHLSPAEHLGSKTGRGLGDGTSPSPGSPVPGQPRGSSSRRFPGLEVPAVRRGRAGSLQLPPPRPVPHPHRLHAAFFLRRATPKRTGGRIAVFILCNSACPLTSVNHPLIGE